MSLGMEIKENGFISKWVRFRTSFVYIYIFSFLIATWIILNKVFNFGWDNSELTFLNLTLSVLTELQGIILLIYTAHISERNRRKDEEEKIESKLLNKKLNKILNMLDDEDEEDAEKAR